MILNMKTGRVAFHSFHLSEECGVPMTFVQLDYDGTPMTRIPTKDEVYIEPQPQ